MNLRNKALLAGMAMGMIHVEEPVTQSLLDEYNLIVDKKSKLSRTKRDEIVARVQKLIKEGKVSTR